KYREPACRLSLALSPRRPQNHRPHPSRNRQPSPFRRVTNRRLFVRCDTDLDRIVPHAGILSRQSPDSQGNPMRRLILAAFLAAPFAAQAQPAADPQTQALGATAPATPAAP